MRSTVQLKYKGQLKKHLQLTCIMGGKCVDGVVLVSDSKITYYDHPPSDVAKLYSEFYHIVTGGAGSTDLYDSYRNHALRAIQPGVTIPEDFRLDRPPVYDTNKPVQTSGVIHMHTEEYNFSLLQNNFGNLVKGINRSKYAGAINGSLEVLVATQLADNAAGELTHITASGPKNVYDYRAIGSSGPYTYIFLKPFFSSGREITMYKFGKIAYFIIRFIERFEIDPNVGGNPQIWFIPNSGELFTDKNKPEWINEYEITSNKILNYSFKQYIMNEFL